MGIALERRAVQQQKDTIKAVGIAIAHAETGELWVNRELKDKPSTARKAGQLTIPFETQKPDELIKATILGGLAEVFDDIDNDGKPVMPDLSRKLFSVDAEYAATPEPFVFQHGGRDIQFDLAILIYDGPKDLNVSPHDSDEAYHVGWMPVDVFLAEDIRHSARIAVKEIARAGMVDKRLSRYKSSPELRHPVITSDFSLRSFYAEREKKIDVGPIEVYHS